MTSGTLLQAGLRKHLVAGRQIVGTFISVPRIEIVEIAAAAGFDLVVLDCEHGPFGVESLPPLIAAGHGSGISVVVRAADGCEQSVSAPLDAGADGVLVPHVGTGADARAAVAASRYAPLGGRSVHPWVRNSRYGFDPGYIDKSNAHTAVMALIEGQDGVANLSEILAVPELDAVFVGPVDLAAAMSLIGQPNHPEVHRRAQEILLSAKAAGKAGAIFAPTVDVARAWFSHGATLVVLSVDIAIISRGFTESIAELTQGPNQSLDGQTSHHYNLSSQTAEEHE